MTITTTADSVTVAGNGALTVFNFSFIMGTKSNAVVTYEDSSGNQTVLATSAYTISLNAAVSPNLWGIGGTVTYSPAIATGTFLIISRIVPLTQATSVSNQAFEPQAIEQAMDEIVMQVQQLATPLNVPLTPTTVPASPTAGWVIYVDSADSDKLKAKASTGTVVTLGTP